MSDAAVWTIEVDAFGLLDEVVREILGTALRIQPTAIQLDRTCRRCGHPTHGKPEVVGHPEFSFNLSHSGPWAVVAHTFAGRIGVDIEVVRDRRHLDRLARRVMAEPEYERWAAGPEAERVVAFARTWTEREAYLKAIGLGIVGGLKAAPDEPAQWTFAPVDGLDGVVGTVAVEAPAVRVTIAPWTAVP